MVTKSKPSKHTRAGKRVSRLSNRRAQWPASCGERLDQIHVLLLGARATARVLEEALLDDESLVVHRYVVRPLTEALEALGYQEPNRRRGAP